MAKVNVSKELVQDLLFGFTPNPIAIEGVSLDAGGGYLTFTISGADVPDTPVVIGLYNVDHNRAGQKMVRLRFEPLH